MASLVADVGTAAPEGGRPVVARGSLARPVDSLTGAPGRGPAVELPGGELPAVELPALGDPAVGLSAVPGGADLALALAVLLLLVGVVGSVVPGVPGALLSLVAVYGYWWSTGWTEPGTAFVAVATVVCLAAVAIDYLAGFVSARAGGASPLTTVVAGVVGILLFFVLGPVGTIAGVALTVFAVEVYRGAGTEEGARTAAVTVVGLLASNVIGILLTASVLVGFLLVVL